MARHESYDDSGYTVDKQVDQWKKIGYLKDLEKVGQAKIAGKKRYKNSFLNTSKIDGEPLIDSKLPEKVNNLRKTMLEHIASQNNNEAVQAGSNPVQKPHARKMVKKRAEKVREAHEAAIGTYPHPNNPDIEIGKEKKIVVISRQH